MVPVGGAGTIAGERRVRKRAKEKGAGVVNAMRVVALLSLCLLASLSQADVIRVAVASNFTAPMKAVVAAFEAASGHRVQLAFGSSGKFFAQINHGAPFQVFFSADQAKPLALEQAGLGVPGTRFTYAVGALALWSHKPATEAEAVFARLKTGDFNRLALANPKLAPYGAAAVEVLRSLQLEVTTKGKWVRGENIAQAYQFARSGNADLGFVALSQITAPGHAGAGSAWVVPRALYAPIRQDALLLRRGENSEAARALLRFVRSDKAQAMIRTYGYRGVPQS